MDEATEYKAYLKALKEATDSVKGGKQDKAAKAAAKNKIINLCLLVVDTKTIK